MKLGMVNPRLYTALHCKITPQLTRHKKTTMPFENGYLLLLFKRISSNNSNNRMAIGIKLIRIHKLTGHMLAIIIPNNKCIVIKSNG
jgi:hypothetical protein